MNRIISLLILLSYSCGALGQNLIPSAFEAWPTPIEKRILVGSFSRESNDKTIKLVGCRNETASAQIACRNSKSSQLSYSLTALRGMKGGENSGRGLACPVRSLLAC